MEARAQDHTILVCEDDEAVRMVICLVLESAGHKVLEAESADQAEQLAAEAGVIHLLVTDVVMPERDGRDLAESLRAARPDMQVLFVSGYTADILESGGDPLQGASLLQKPFTPDALIERVTAILAQEEIEGAAAEGNWAG